MLFTTALFQKGAVKYAVKHGIALIRITHWHESFAAFSQTRQIIPEDELDYAFWFTALDDQFQFISTRKINSLKDFISS